MPHRLAARSAGPHRRTAGAVGTAFSTASCRPHTAPLVELLTPSFLRRHSRFTDLDGMLAAGHAVSDGLTAADPVRVQAWSDFIRGSSSYADWNAMLREAGAEWLIRRIGIVIEP